MFALEVHGFAAILFCNSNSWKTEYICRLINISKNIILFFYEGIRGERDFQTCLCEFEKLKYLFYVCL